MVDSPDEQFFGLLRVEPDYVARTSALKGMLDEHIQRGKFNRERFSVQTMQKLDALTADQRDKVFNAAAVLIARRASPKEPIFNLRPPLAKCLFDTHVSADYLAGDSLSWD